jgi:sulfoxide reductase heme-binding subunit YedZ
MIDLKSQSTSPSHSEMMGQTNGKDVRTSVITATVLALITLLVGTRFLETLENVQTTSAPKWILGRSTGLAAYVLLYCLTAMGLLLSHPRRVNWKRPSPLTRIRIHVSLAVFTLVFLLSHIIVLASDPYAGVGVIGTLLPFTAHYRPFAVSLGILAVWSGLISGITASLAGSRVLVRVWWPLHKIALTAFVFTWFHSVLAGTDTVQLKFFYGTSAIAMVALTLWRYLSLNQKDKVEAISHKATSWSNSVGGNSN